MSLLQWDVTVSALFTNHIGSQAYTKHLVAPLTPEVIKIDFCMHDLKDKNKKTYLRRETKHLLSTVEFKK